MCQALALSYSQRQTDDLRNLASGVGLSNDSSEQFSNQSWNDQQKIVLRFSEQMTLGNPIRRRAVE
jgi:hypothetical protein